MKIISGGFSIQLLLHLYLLSLDIFPLKEGGVEEMDNRIIWDDRIK